MTTRGRITVGLAVLAAAFVGFRSGRLLGETAAERRRARRGMGVA